MDDDLPLVAAAGVDFGETGRLAEQRLDLEILNQLQLHQLRLARGRLVRRGGGVVHAVIENLAESGGDGREFGRETGGQILGHRLQTLAHELAHPQQVHMVVENHRDLRQPELGERAELLQPRQAAHLVLDGEGDLFFNFLRRERADGGIDLHLWAGDVRHGVQRQPQRGPHAQADEHGRQHEDERALADGELDEAGQHKSMAGATALAAAQRLDFCQPQRQG